MASTYKMFSASASGSGLACAALAMFSTPLHAQSTQPRPADASPGSIQVEEVVVTGTKIRGAAPTGSTVTVLGRDSIEGAAEATADRLLRKLPQMSAIGATEGMTRGQFDPASNRTYGNGVNLRSLGPDATLVLVNSHRIARSGSFGNFTDVSAIPTIAIERIEVVADGASAIYGSDAVGGVVNLILRDDFDGVRTSFRGSRGDGFDEWKMSALLGHSWGSGSVTFAAERYHRDNLAAADRAYYTQDMRPWGGRDYRSLQSSPGNITVGGVTYAIPRNQNGVGLTPADLIVGQPNLQDANYMTDILPEQDRKNAVITFKQELGERLRFFGDAFYSDRDFNMRPTGAAAGTVIVPNTNPFFVHPTNPNAASVPVAYSYVNDLGPRNDIGYSTDYAAAGTLEFDLTDTWRLQASAFWNGNDSLRAQHNTVNNAQLAAALADTNPATALNVFGTGATNPATIDAIRARSDVLPSNETYGFSMQAEGALFDLPGGTVKVVVGASFMDESYEFENAGSLDGPYEVTEAAGTSRENKAIYAELFVPVVSAANALPGIQELTLSLAGRAEEYSSAAGSTENPKIGITWSPLEQLDVRASYGTSFRAPAIAYTVFERGRLITTGSVVDPRTGQQVQRLLRTGGNPDLEPETARTLSAGIDWRPEFIDSTQLSLTWYSVRYQDRVGRPSININQYEIYQPYIIRDPDAATVTPYLDGEFGRFVGIRPDEAEVRYIVDQRFQNLGSFRMSGVDVSATYEFDTDFGSFSLSASATHLIEYEEQIARGLEFIDRLDLTGWPQSWRGRAELGWRYGSWRAALSGIYVGSYTNDTVEPNVSIDSFMTADLTVGYSFLDIGDWLKDMRVQFSVQNLFDSDPPFVEYVSGPGLYGFDPSAASPLGRVVGLGVSLDF